MRTVFPMYHTRYLVSSRSAHFFSADDISGGPKLALLLSIYLHENKRGTTRTYGDSAGHVIYYGIPGTWYLVVYN